MVCTESWRILYRQCPSLSRFTLSLAKNIRISITSVRSLNYILIAATCLLLWKWSLLFKKSSINYLHILCLLAILGGYSIIFSYRSGRNDCLLTLLGAGILYSGTLKESKINSILLFILGALSAWAGPQLLPVLLFSGCLVIIYLKKPFFKKVIITWDGVMSGLILLIAFYSFYGVLDKFILSFKAHTELTFIHALLSGQFIHHNRIPKDFSFWPPFISLCIIVIYRIKKKTLQWKSAISYGLISSFIIPSASIVILGKFPTYYGWAIYIPVVLCLASTLMESKSSAFERNVGITGLIAAIIIGTGLHLTAGLYNYSDRNYNNIDKLFKESVKDQDYVYGDRVIYYASKKWGGNFQLSFMNINQKEKAHINVLIIKPEEFSGITAFLGGTWESTGQKNILTHKGFPGITRNMGFLNSFDYELEVFRKQEILNRKQ